MKKRLTNIAIVGLCLTVLVGCKNPIPQEENVKLDIPSNIVISAEDNTLAYYTIENTELKKVDLDIPCLLYTSPSPRDGLLSRMPSSA